MAEEYSSPLAREAARIIRTADASSFAGSMGRFLLGLGICIAAGIFLSTCLTIIIHALFDSSYVGWWGWFWLYVLILVPWIIWYERKRRQDFLLDAISSNDNPSTMGEHLNLLSGVVTSLLVWGPRGLVDGLRGMVGRRTVLQSAVLDRAVLLVLDLNAATEKVDIKKLIHPPEDMQVFAQAVDMLDALDLIGKSKDGASLWLISTFRQKLVDSTKFPPAV